MTGTRDPFKKFSFPVMQSTFCFADVKILAVPTTRLINNFRHLRTVNLKRYNHTFSTSIYRKKTFTGLYTKWDSFTPRKYKVNLIRTLTFRCFRICSSPPLLRSCLDELRKLLLQNGYPAGVINYNINQGHPLTVFCKISVRISKYRLKISTAPERLNISGYPLH